MPSCVFRQTAEQLLAMPYSARSGRRYTLDEFERIRNAASPGPRYEYLDGAILATPSPNLRHQRIIVLLTIILEPFRPTGLAGW